MPHLTTCIQELHIDLRKSKRTPALFTIFTLTFSRLISLVIGGLSVNIGEDRNSIQSEAMEFWRRHPSLERLGLVDKMNRNTLFSENIDVKFLPNLKHLKVRLYLLNSNCLHADRFRWISNDTVLLFGSPVTG